MCNKRAENTANFGPVLKHHVAQSDQSVHVYSIRSFCSNTLRSLFYAHSAQSKLSSADIKVTFYTNISNNRHRQQQVGGTESAEVCDHNTDPFYTDITLDHSVLVTQEISPGSRQVLGTIY